MMSFKVAGESQYLVITGAWIKGMKLAKRAWILPGQSCTILDISHVHYPIQLQAMSADNVTFNLPAVITIGPSTKNKETLLKCAKLMSSRDNSSNILKYLVEGVLQSKTRDLAACMAIDQIWHKAKLFSRQLIKNAQLELNQFGFTIYYASIYYSYPNLKTQIEAANQAMVRDGQTLQNAATYQAGDQGED